MDEKKICENIKKLRKAKRLSLERLANLSGLTRGYLSKIESSEKAPPLTTLTKISRGLGIDTSFLIAAEPETPEDVRLCIVRTGERNGAVEAGSIHRYTYEALAHRKPGKNMEPYLITPAFDEKTVFSHEGEEFLFTLEGMHEFIYGDRTYMLQEGDSIYFDSVVPHTGRSIGEKRAKILAVIYSYKRL